MENGRREELRLDEAEDLSGGGGSAGLASPSCGEQSGEVWGAARLRAAVGEKWCTPPMVEGEEGRRRPPISRVPTPPQWAGPPCFFKHSTTQIFTSKVAKRAE